MLIHTLVILMMLRRHLSSFITAFRYFHEIWSGLEADKLLYLLMALLNSFLEKGRFQWNFIQQAGINLMVLSQVECLI